MYNPILMSRRNELLQALDATPRDLARTLRNVSPTTRGTRIAPDQWSISDILNHINSVEIQSHTRLQRVATESNPVLPTITPNPTHYDQTATLEDLLARFTTARAQTLAFLHPLSSGIWARPATLANGQKTTFRSLVQALVDHDTEHLNQLVETKAKLSRL